MKHTPMVTTADECEAFVANGMGGASGGLIAPRSEKPTAIVTTALAAVDVARLVKEKPFILKLPKDHKRSFVRGPNKATRIFKAELKGALWNEYLDRFRSSIDKPWLED